MIVVTLIYFGSDDATEVAKASDTIHNTQAGVSILSHYAFLEQEASPGAPKSRMVGISITDVDNDDALEKARHTLLSTKADVHIAKALKIDPGLAEVFNRGNPPPPGVDTKST